MLPNKDFGGTRVTTNADGLVQFTIYPGETPVFYAVLVRLVDDPNSDRYFSPYWAFITPDGWGGTLPVGEQLNADIRESINQAYAGQQPEPMPTDPIRAVDWLVHLQENAPRINGLSFGPVHGANGGEAVAIWPMGKPPKVNPDGSIVESENVRILDQKLFVNAIPDAADGQRVGARQRQRPGARHGAARLGGGPRQPGDVLRLADGDQLATTASAAAWGRTRTATRRSR